MSWIVLSMKVTHCQLKGMRYCLATKLLLLTSPNRVIAASAKWREVWQFGSELSSVFYFFFRWIAETHERERTGNSKSPWHRGSTSGRCGSSERHRPDQNTSTSWTRCTRSQAPCTLLPSPPLLQWIQNNHNCDAFWAQVFDAIDDGRQWILRQEITSDCPEDQIEKNILLARLQVLPIWPLSTGALCTSHSLKSFQQFFSEPPYPHFPRFDWQGLGCTCPCCACWRSRACRHHMWSGRCTRESGSRQRGAAEDTTLAGPRSGSQGSLGSLQMTSAMAWENFGIGTVSGSSSPWKQWRYSLKVLTTMKSTCSGLWMRLENSGALTRS